jgi:hypothetical protein
MAEVSRTSVLKGAAVGAVAAGGAGAFLSGRVARAASAAPANKVTRSGTQLLLNGQPYRMVGLDMWPMAIASWCQPPNYDGRNVSQISQVLADIRQTAPNVNAIKVWFYQQFALHSGSRDWSSFDAVLAAADAAGFKVIANLEDSWSYERTGSQSPEVGSAWYNGGYQNSVLSKEGIPYRQWVQECVTRYANDPRILMWELVAEPNGITLSFVQDVSALVKGIDPDTLICCGEVGPLSSSIYALSTVDIASHRTHVVRPDELESRAAGRCGCREAVVHGRVRDQLRHEPFHSRFYAAGRHDRCFPVRQYGRVHVLAVRGDWRGPVQLHQGRPCAAGAGPICASQRTSASPAGSACAGESG